MASTTKPKILEQAEAAGVDFAALPAHVAIIMDGNGRWANRRGLGRLLGHREGYLALRNVVRMAGDLGLGYLTVYGFSSENWRRPEAEVKGLMSLIESAMLEQIDHLRESNVRVRIAGRLHELPESLQRALQKGMDDTAHCTGLTFILAINYGGRAEIIDAVRAIEASGGEVSEQSVSAHLYLPDVPEPDLMIRTAGEMRWSNFLIWQAAYAELFVTEVAWPEFSETELVQAVATFQGRTRKFGGLATE